MFRKLAAVRDDRIVLVIAAIALALFPRLAQCDKWVWNPDTGWRDTAVAPSDDAQERYRHALTLITAKQYSAGIAVLRQIVEEQPKTELAADSLLQIAGAYQYAGRHRKAFKTLEAFRKNFLTCWNRMDLGLFPSANT